MNKVGKSNDQIAVAISSIADMYYDRQGKPIKDVAEWVRLFEDPEYKVIRQDYTPNKKYWVSTVWLGLNHGWGSDVPIIFETMVFQEDGESKTDVYEERYATEAEALAGHKRLLKKWSAKG